MPPKPLTCLSEKGTLSQVIILFCSSLHHLNHVAVLKIVATEECHLRKSKLHYYQCMYPTERAHRKRSERKKIWKWLSFCFCFVSSFCFFKLLRNLAGFELCSPSQYECLLVHLWVLPDRHELIKVAWPSGAGSYLLRPAGFLAVIQVWCGRLQFELHLWWAGVVIRPPFKFKG